MQRTTIDFGIDLGTTNSAIAALQGSDVEVFKNNENHEFTPSAVWIDKKNRLHVGRRAKERVYEDEENAAQEFKLLMGQDSRKNFKRTGQQMTPEELSSEILKSLKADVTQRSGEEVKAAVITVPAAFDLPQCDATKKAATLAGFAQSPLLQEPVAAAMAYGFQEESEKVFWLIFDLGGGTFDSAVVQLREGVIQVVNHGGDNHLGGKLLDWAIVEELLIPAVTREYRLSDFRRGNPKWLPAIAKLKLKAEEAKIRVSREPYADITIDNLCTDDRGDSVDVEFELTATDLARVCRPFFVRAANICKKVLSEKRLAPGDLEKVLLVGGPTLMPILRDFLSDPAEGLGIPLACSVDPLTVVARGAAIFAGSQPLDVDYVAEKRTGQYAIMLDYKPMGPDTDPMVGGRVTGDDDDLTGFTLEFVNNDAQPPWRSGRIDLAPDGSFFTELSAEKGKRNTFMIELCDRNSTKCVTVPDHLKYMVSGVVEGVPLTHSLGIALASNQVDRFFEKGAQLPLRKREVFRTARATAAGKGQGEALKIPVIEGENRRADRNRLIGHLLIASSDIRRDLPAGSDVEVTIQVSDDRLLTTEAYVPFLDQDFKEVISLKSATPSASDLKQRFDQEKGRLAQAKAKVAQTGDREAQEKLNRIEEERIVEDVAALSDATAASADAAGSCQNRLLDLAAAIDEVEDKLEWPGLVADAEMKLQEARQLMQQLGEAGDQSAFDAHERDVRRLIAEGDADLLRRKLDEVERLKLSVLTKQPAFWVGFLQQLQSVRHQMSDQARADQFFSEGQRAIAANNVQALQGAVRNLLGLLPTEVQAQMQGYGSGITK